MGTLLINEDRAIWFGLIVSLMAHGFLFALSGRTFIQDARYSVQPSVQSVEVDIEEIKSPAEILQKGEGPVKATEKTNKPNKTREAAPSKSGARVKANPNYFQNPAPEYPEFAKQMRQEGIVMLSVDVDKEGDPVSVDIIQSSGHHLLDEAALKAVRHWKFQPGRIGDVAVESRVTIPVRFQLLMAPS